MKKLIYLLPFIFITCTSSEDDDENINQSNFSVDYQISTSNVLIDETFSINFTSNVPMTNIQTSTDNFISYKVCNVNNLLTKEIYFNYDTPGLKTFQVRVINSNNENVTKTFSIQVNRGNAVKINGLQVTTFNNINQTWDPEFSNTDPNRLADLQFSFVKFKLSGICSTNGINDLWFLSNTIQNQGTMSWDLSSANLYCDPNRNIGFGLIDVDNGNIVQDLIGSLPSKTFSFSSYTATKPNVITFNYPDVNLSFNVSLDWP